MNILVCISRVPDTTSKINIKSDSKSIETQGLKYVVNPYDEFAMDEALRIRTKLGGKITVLTVGTEASKDILRTALALSIDRAVLIKSDADLDSSAIAKNIADFANSENFDLILAGKQSIDYSSGAVPAMTAALLNYPIITIVTKLDIDGQTITVEREVESGAEVISCSLPCVITAQKGLNEPRYPKLPDIMKAKSKPIEEITCKYSDNAIEVLSIDTVQKSRVGKIFGNSSEEIAELVNLLKNEAKVI